MRIRLESGLLLIDVEGMIEQKFAQWPWEKYDGERPGSPDVLTSADINRAYRLGARTARSAYDRLVRDDGRKITRLLARIPREPLEDVDLDECRPHLTRLFDVVCRKGIRLAGATKLLSPLRPSLLPVVDSIVDHYYWFASSIRDERSFRRLESAKGWGGYLVELLSLVRADVRAARGQIDRLRYACTGKPYSSASRVRLLEALIWFYYARAGRR
jgi:hypothetical protein